MPRVSTSGVLQVLVACITVAASASLWLFEAPEWMGPSALLVGFAALSLFQWNRWRNHGSAWGGIFIAYPVVFTVAYTLGSLKLGPRGVLGVDPDAEQWLLYAGGLAAFLVGASISARRAPSRPGAFNDAFTASAFPRLIGIVALGLAVVNFSTGGVTLFAGDINESRFVGSSALLGPLTGVIVGAEQFAIVALALQLWRRKETRRSTPAIDTLILLALVLSLGLTASRTFIVLPLLALVFARLEFRVVKVTTVLVVAALGFAALTGYNLYRQGQSGTAEALDASLQENGLAQYPLASGLLSLQIGPRVFQLTRDKMPEMFDYRGGQFFLADASPILRLNVPPSDSFTTTYITNRSYAAVGGSPPTVLGGLFIDGGVPLLLAGMAVVGLLTRWIRNRYLRAPSIPWAAAYGYWSAWMIHSIYNYLSLKPMVLTFLVLCALYGASSLLRPRSRRSPRIPLAQSERTARRIQGAQR